MGCPQYLPVGIQGLQLLFIRLLDMSFNGMSSVPPCRLYKVYNSFFIRLLDMSFNGMFSDPFCRCTMPICRSGLTSRHVFQWDVLKSAL